ncbi:MAG: hypothetical protein KJP03_00345 [Gammaproteobacteria bacterium]|nr:hypothetical protein [Gammaproteobacteria bacterium]
MLKEIAVVTITVSNLAQVEEAWQEHFAYTTVASGTISSELAEHWQAPRMAGDDYVLMQPANDAPAYVRLIKDPAVAGYRPMTSHGWNATELLVSDTDAVAAGMVDSAFDVIGAPRPLWDAPDAPRVMQALGPGNELLYLTTNNQAKAGLGLDDSMPLVERPFIMVAGGASMEAFRAFYVDTLGLTMSEPAPFRITMISKANDLPLDTTYPLSVVNLSPGYLLEVDELPAALGPRAVSNGRLPSGVAVVGITADTLVDGLDWASPPQTLDELPYGGREVGLLRGPGGELIEVIVTPAKTSSSDAATPHTPADTQ